MVLYFTYIVNVNVQTNQMIFTVFKRLYTQLKHTLIIFPLSNRRKLRIFFSSKNRKEHEKLQIVSFYI